MKEEPWVILVQAEEDTNRSRRRKYINSKEMYRKWNQVCIILCNILKDPLLWLFLNLSWLFSEVFSKSFLVVYARNLQIIILFRYLKKKSNNFTALINLFIYKRAKISRKQSFEMVLGIYVTRAWNILT